MGSITLRPSNEFDARFIYRVIEDTMRGHVEATWGRWLPERVQRECEEDAIDPNMRIVQHGGIDCGVFHSEIEGGAVWVRMLFILASHQRLGIGRELLNRVVGAAFEQQMSVRLRVLKVNPAKRFYEDQAFLVYEETAEFFYMQREPAVALQTAPG